MPATVATSIVNEPHLNTSDPARLAQLTRGGELAVAPIAPAECGITAEWSREAAFSNYTGRENHAWTYFDSAFCPARYSTRSRNSLLDRCFITSAGIAESPRSRVSISFFGRCSVAPSAVTTVRE